MKLHEIQPSTTRSNRRAGRGYGSTKGGHTSGRGQKGQKARSKVPLWFEGGQLPQIKRLPFTRGKNRFVSLSHETVVVNVSSLNVFKAGSKVSPKVLMEQGLISEKELINNPLKILGRGELNVSLEVSVPVSKGALQKIESAGGKVIS